MDSETCKRVTMDRRTIKCASMARCEALGIARAARAASLREMAALPTSTVLLYPAGISSLTISSAQKGRSAATWHFLVDLFWLVVPRESKVKSGQEMKT